MRGLAPAAGAAALLLLAAAWPARAEESAVERNLRAMAPVEEPEAAPAPPAVEAPAPAAPARSRLIAVPLPPTRPAAVTAPTPPGPEDAPTTAALPASPPEDPAGSAAPMLDPAAGAPSAGAPERGGGAALSDEEEESRSGPDPEKQIGSVSIACLKPELIALIRETGAFFGKIPIITSGYRARGRRGSLHRRCMAADFFIPGVPTQTLTQYLRRLPQAGGVGTYCHTKLVHLDVGEPRNWGYCGLRRTYFAVR